MELPDEMDMDDQEGSAEDDAGDAGANLESTEAADRAPDQQDGGPDSLPDGEAAAEPSEPQDEADQADPEEAAEEAPADRQQMDVDAEAEEDLPPDEAQDLQTAQQQGVCGWCLP